VPTQTEHKSFCFISMGLSPDICTCGASDLAVRRTMAALDQSAEQWAAQTDLTAQVAAVAQMDDRESRIEALMKLAFVEGAYAVFCKAKDDGILDTGLPEIRAEVERLREDNKLLALFFSGAAPDANTQSEEEQEATMVQIDAAVGRALA
jgi:hypothetical protein